LAYTPKVKKQVFDPASLMQDALREINIEKYTKDKPLNIIEYAKEILRPEGRSLFRSQDIILKFFYAGTLFNDKLEITRDDLEFISSWDIPQYWITAGEKSKISVVEKNIQNFKTDPANNFFKEMVLVLGRRSGKSFLSSLIASYEAYKLIQLGDPHKYYGIDGDIWIINTAISGSQAENIIFSQIKKFVNRFPLLKNRIYKESSDFIILFSDKDLELNENQKRLGLPIFAGSIVLSSGNSNSSALRGNAASCIIYDEMAHYVDTNGKAAAQEVYSALSPSTATFTYKGDGRNIAISSPDLAAGFFYNYYNSAKSLEHMIMFQIPTWNANPNITLESLSGAFDLNYDRSSAEFGAQFRSSGGNIFIPHSLIKEALVSRENWYKSDSGLMGKTYYLHIDPARNSDRWAILIAHPENRYDNASGKSITYVVEDYSCTFKADHGKILDPDEIMENHVFPLIKRFNIVSVSSDPFLSLEQAKKLRQRGILYREVSFSGGNKFKIYDRMREFFVTKRVILCNDDLDLAGELMNITIDYNRVVPKLRNVPSDRDFPYDDLVDCLAGVIDSIAKGASGQTQLPKIATVRLGIR